MSDATGSCSRSTFVTLVNKFTPSDDAGTKGIDKLLLEVTLGTNEIGYV